MNTGAWIIGENSLHWPVGTPLQTPTPTLNQHRRSTSTSIFREAFFAPSAVWISSRWFTRSSCTLLASHSSWTPPQHPFSENKFLFSLPIQILSRFLPRFPFLLRGEQPLSIVLFCIVSLADSWPLLFSCYIFSPSQSRSPSPIMTLSHGPNDTKLRYQTTVSSNPDIHFTKPVQLQKYLMPLATEPYPFHMQQQRNGLRDTDLCYNKISAHN